jgi:phospholipid/cholesterol/gamma-HCH transport system permease protein
MTFCRDDILPRGSFVILRLPEFRSGSGARIPGSSWASSRSSGNPLAKLPLGCYWFARMLIMSIGGFRNWIQGLGELALLAREIARAVFAGRVNGRDLAYQLYFIGVKSQSVVFITGAFTGMVLCAQTFFQFHKVRMDTATLAVVSVSMCSELGPVLTALMVAGRVGAALAAELGTMKVTEQIDALRTLATHPVDYLVVPRVLATALAMPVLTAASIALGIGAAWALGVFVLDIEPVYAWHNMLRYTTSNHVFIGVFKALIYGTLISTISCYKGMTCGEGAEGVGRATTEAVVYSSITVLISNFFLTMFLNNILPSA